MFASTITLVIKTSDKVFPMKIHFRENFQSRFCCKVILLLDLSILYSPQYYPVWKSDTSTGDSSSRPPRTYSDPSVASSPWSSPRDPQTPSSRRWSGAPGECWIRCPSCLGSGTAFSCRSRQGCACGGSGFCGGGSHEGRHISFFFWFAGPWAWLWRWTCRPCRRREGWNVGKSLSNRIWNKWIGTLLQRKL